MFDTIYVSQKKGSDDFKGDLQNPLKTIETALKRVCALRNAGESQPVSIVLLDEEYLIEKPIYIKKPLGKITICGGKNTTIYGGFKIEKFKKDVFNGHECFSAFIPQIKDGFWFTDFFVDSNRADFTSIPKDGFFIPEKVENTAEVYDAESKWFIPKPEEIEKFKNIKNFNDCIISYYHYWVDGHSPLESFDDQSGKIQMKYKSRYSISGFSNGAIMRYKIENVAEAFENPNEWYLDRNTCTVYYIPRDKNQTPDSIKAYAPVCEKLFIIQGEENDKIEDILFKDLTFAVTKGDYESRVATDTHMILPDSEVGYSADEQSVDNAWGAIEFKYAEKCSIENCSFKNLGLHAVNVTAGCNNIRIYGNRFYDIGAGAVKIGGGAYGCKKTEETWGNEISQNHISYCGRRYSAACGILIKHSYNNTISHNDIGHLYYTGISVGWVWGYQDSITKGNIIEKNHVHHIGQGKLSDMGGIYMLGVQPGTIVRNNIVHDVSGFRYGGTGIYTDEGSSYILIENNILYNIQSAAFHQHYGEMNTIRNNIVVKSGETMHHARTEDHTGIVSENNILVTDGSYSIGYGYDDEPDKGYVYTINGTHNLHYDMGGNHRVIKINEEEYSLKEVQEKFGLEKDSVINNPMFFDYENNDFTLSDNSPAYELGFKKIDTSDVGVTIKK